MTKSNKLKLNLGLIALAVCTSASAITINNQNTQQVTYKIYTNMTMTECAHGQLSPGQPVTWTTAGSSWLHPLCGGKNGPAHVEVAVYGASGLAVNCTPTGSHNPRLNNIGTVAKVTRSSIGVHCYTN